MSDSDSEYADEYGEINFPFIDALPTDPDKLILFVGRPGSGKSVAMMAHVSNLLARGQQNDGGGCRSAVVFTSTAYSTPWRKLLIPNVVFDMKRHTERIERFVSLQEAYSKALGQERARKTINTCFVLDDVIGKMRGVASGGNPQMNHLVTCYRHITGHGQFLVSTQHSRRLGTTFREDFSLAVIFRSASGGNLRGLHEDYASEFIPDFDTFRKILSQLPRFHALVVDRDANNGKGAVFVFKANPGHIFDAGISFPDPYEVADEVLEEEGPMDDEAERAQGLQI